LIKKYLFIFFLLFSSTLIFGQVKPTDISGIQLWLRSDSAYSKDASNNILSWDDCSGNTNNATQASSSNRPKWIDNSLNGKPVIRFDAASNQYLNFNQLTLSNFSFFIVFKKNLSSNSGVLLGNSSSSDYIGNWSDGNVYMGNGTVQPYATTGNITNYSYLSITYDGNNANFYLNGTHKGLNTGAAVCNYNQVGARSSTGTYLDGDIAEIIIYNTIISTSDRVAIENYLHNKYAPRVDLGPDFNISYGFCDTTLDAGNGFTSFLWSTGETTQIIQVDTSSAYSVTVTDIFGYTSSDTIIVTYPQINLHDTLFCSGNNVTLSTGLIGIYNYTWTGGLTTPSISVNAPGNYSVTVTDTNSCTAVSDTIYVSEDNFPSTASLGADTNLCVGNTIGLIAPVPLPDGLNYNWSTFATTPTIPIMTSGSYAITVTDLNSCVATDTITITVVGTAPDINFTYTAGCSGESSVFTNTSNPVGTAWLWDFGDGQTSNLQNPSHTYGSGGNSTVGLTVTSGSCINYKDSIIHIPYSPSASFTASDACINNPYTFTDQSTSTEGNIISWDWDFGDGSIHSTAQNPQHTYTSPGNKIVALTVQTDSGCQNITAHQLTVVSSAPAPTVFSLYQPSNNYSTEDNLINFGWNSSLNASSYTMEYSTDSLFLSNVISIPNLVLTNFLLNISIPQKYYWRIVAIGICGNPTISNIFNFTIFSPSNLSGLNLWLKSDSVILNSNKVETWNDCSGNNNHAVQLSPANQPLWINNELNKKPVIQYNGSNQFFNIGNIALSNFSFFTVFKKNVISNSGVLLGNSSSNDYLGNWNDGNTYMGNGIIQPSAYTGNIINYSYLDITYNGNNANFYINGIYKGTNSGSVTCNYNEIAARTSTEIYLDGDIAEIIIYDTALSNLDRQTIENYLSNKYAPPVNLGPDINITYGLCDTTLDSGGRFTHFIWSTGDTTQTISITQSGQYSVTATNIFGQLSHDDVLVNLPSFMIQDTAFCLGSSLALSANLGSSYNYLWLPDSVTSETFTITQPGNYSLSVYDTIGCQRTMAFTVTADSFAVQASLGPDKNVCQGDILTLAVGAQQATSYLWSNSTGNNYLSITDAPGTSPDYSVTVTDVNGCTATDTISLHIIGAMPVVSFISDSVCFGNETHFTDQSTVPPPSTITSYFWEFGDNDTSVVQDPVHLYAHAGPYQVHLTVTTDSGCVKKFSKNIIVYSMPAVSFLPYNGCNGKEVPFTDLTFCPFGNLSEWHWDFGDTYGTGYDTSSLPNPVYIYDSAGTYTVKLITSSVAGCTDSTEHTITINQSPQVAFSNSSSCAGQIVYFTDETSIPPWETITEHQWLFGDGTGTSATNPSHVYDAPGTYEVSLNVSILNGCSATYTKQLVVGAIPDARFGYSDNCANTTTQFTDSSTSALGAIDQWSWKFGSIGASATQNPGVAFPDTGIYKVTLSVNTEHNCVDSITLPVRVYPLPKAAFSFSPEYGIPPLPVSFTNHSTGAATYLWAFGDGDNDVSLNPDHTYLLQGIFDVLLTAYNTIGCPDTISHRVYVLPTTVDILVSNTTATLNGNILNVSTDLMNNGSRKIEHIDIALQLEGGNVIHEHWYGALMQGEIIPYAFNAQPEIPGGQAVNYICVTASLLPELQEDDVSNNLSCKVLSSGFNLSEPYPNPVVSKLVIAYVLPFDGAVKVELFNEIGEKVMDVFDGEGQEGYHAHTVDLSALGAGVYSYRVLFHENSLRKKFVKM